MIYSVVKVFFGILHLPFPRIFSFPGMILPDDLDQVSGDRSRGAQTLMNQQCLFISDMIGVTVELL